MFLVLGILVFNGRLYAYDPELVGKYDMEIKIGDRIFHDILHITSSTENSHNNQVGSFIGTLEVPGVFTAELEKATYQIALQTGTVYIQFEILAQENGKEFRVKYSAAKNKISNVDRITGKAMLENYEFLGTFTAIKIKEEN